MTQEQLNAFLEKVKGETSLQEKLKAAKSQDDVVSIAKDQGHVFGTEHIRQLSEEELESLDGGNYGDNWIQDITSKPNQELIDWAYKTFGIS